MSCVVSSQAYQSLCSKYAQTGDYNSLIGDVWPHALAEVLNVVLAMHSQNKSVEFVHSSCCDATLPLTNVEVKTAERSLVRLEIQPEGPIAVFGLAHMTQPFWHYDALLGTVEGSPDLLEKWSGFSGMKHVRWGDSDIKEISVASTDRSYLSVSLLMSVSCGFQCLWVCG